MHGKVEKSKGQRGNGRSQGIVLVWMEMAVKRVKEMISAQRKKCIERAAML